MDRQRRSENWIAEHQSTRDQWKGVAAIRTPYKPRTYELNDTQGKPVALKKQAKAMAEYLSTKHWGYNKEEAELTAKISNGRINKKTPRYHVPVITVPHVERILQQFKADKAPGPDYLEAELFKALPTEALQIITDHLSEWIETGTQETDQLKARVASLFKKGDYKSAENYRPISLLNTIYKLKARIVKDILEEGIDEELQPTQYAFRKTRSTLQPIHCIRRFMDKAERAGDPLGIILLDWEKAFDKITRTSLIHTLRRFQIDEKVISLVESLYADTQFYVNFNGGSSTYQSQHTGIRQGCPLSPYLFVIVMTAMWADINEALGYNKREHFIKCVEKDEPTFNELLYADDTLIFHPRVAQLTKTLGIVVRESENME